MKAVKRNLLAELKDQCPVSLVVIKNYLSILKHAYFFNIGLQRQSVRITEIFPSVLKCTTEWNIMKDKTSASGKQLCELLVSEFQSRFIYELDFH